MKKGLFITLEGVDTAGKSTQAELLSKKLAMDGFKVKVIHFPCYEAPIGELIGRVLKGEVKLDSKTLQMLYVTDQLSMRKEIEEALSQGVVVVCDRYDLSTAIYYSCLTGKPDAFEEIYTYAQNDFLRPDCTFVLNMKADEIIKRKQELDVLEKNTKLMEDISEYYSKISEVVCDKRVIYPVDATADIVKIENDIYSYVKTLMRGE